MRIPEIVQLGNYCVLLVNICSFTIFSEFVQTNWPKSDTKKVNLILALRQMASIYHSMPFGFFENILEPKHKFVPFMGLFQLLLKFEKMPEHYLHDT